MITIREATRAVKVYSIADHYRNPDKMASHLDKVDVNPAAITDAQILFLWHERLKDGRIKVWMEDGILHFTTECHPGCSMELP